MAKRKRGSIKYPLDGDNPAVGILPESFWSKMIIKQNNSKGSIYEKMAAMVVHQHIKEFGEVEDFNIIVDKVYFDCFENEVKRRRIDIFVPELELAFEVKSYRVGFRKFIREQIKKDNWLLQNKKLKEIRWLLFEGATKGVLKELTKNKIIYIDISGGEENFTNISALFNPNK